MKVIIREEQKNDYEAISQVTALAFADMKYSNQTEPAIINALRDNGALALSLVAVDKNEIVGHIAFSSVKIDGKDHGWFGLGPVAVHPEWQGKNIGSKLIRQGLDIIKSRGVAGCVLVGEPDYYRRFGFENDSALFYEGPPAEYFMRLAFGSVIPAGRVEYDRSFNVD